MDRRIIDRVIILFFAAAIVALAAEKETAKKTAVKTGTVFDMTGTVTKHGVDNCMEGDIKYDLHPTSGGAVRLSDGHRHDLMVLEEAARNGKPVRVEGTWQAGLRPDCSYVKVNKATATTPKAKAK